MVVDEDEDDIDIELQLLATNYMKNYDETKIF